MDRPKIRIVSADEAEEAGVVLCGDADGGPYPWDDNVETTCAGCGKAIVHRPHAPKKPLKMCLGCVVAGMEAEGKHNGH